MIPLEQYINTLPFSLHPEHRQLLIDTAEIRHFSKYKTVLLEIEKSNHLYIILKGIVRGYYLDTEGTIYTKCFCAETEYFSSEGLRTNKASTFSIQCIEDVDCIKIPYHTILEISTTNQQVSSFISQCYILEVAKLEHRQKLLLVADSTTRYQTFCKQYPSLCQRLPLQYIASYIGIQPASLSRIRKKLQST